MNPINFMLTALSIVQVAAPLVPEVVAEGKQIVDDAETIIGHVRKLDASATIADIEGLFAHVQTDLPTFTKVLAASKSIKL